MMMSLPPGAEADARDAQMGQTLDDSDMDEGALKAQFEEFAEVFLYDAGDAAEEWWINWGRYAQEAKGGEEVKHMSFGFQMMSMMSEVTSEQTYEE